MLSALNAHHGLRAVAAPDVRRRPVPRFFQHVNQHGVPSRAMASTWSARSLVILLGGAVEIYTFSNIGYTGSFLTVLVGYSCCASSAPMCRGPSACPSSSSTSRSAWLPSSRSSGSTAGLATRRIGTPDLLLPRLGRRVGLRPLYLYRTRVEDKRLPPPGPEPVPDRRPTRRHEVSEPQVRAVLLATEERESSEPSMSWPRAHRPRVGRPCTSSPSRASGARPSASPARASCRRRRSGRRQRGTSTARSPASRRGPARSGVASSAPARRELIAEEASGSVRRDRHGPDPPATVIVRNFMWSQEPIACVRRAKVIHVVSDHDAGPGSCVPRPASAVRRADPRRARRSLRDRGARSAARAAPPFLVEDGAAATRRYVVLTGGRPRARRRGRRCPRAR